MRPFRFGLIMTSIESRTSWRDRARRIENAGFSVLLAPDHFALPLAPVPALMSAAEATSTLRVGTYVLAAGFRHPAVLAKEAASLDVLTGGRFELGLGAGWNSAEFARAGIPFERGRIRFEQVADAVQIIKASLAGGPVTYAGTRYTTEGVECPIRPVQNPLPLLLGGGGRRMLTFAAREAAIVGLMGVARGGVIDMSTLGEKATRRRIDWIRDAAGQRFDDLELNLFMNQSWLTGDRVAAAAEIARAGSLDPAMVLESPHYLLGTADEMREQLIRVRAELGVSYFSFFERDLPQIAGVVGDLASA